ncbi:MAG: hypothetical protein IKC26_04665 [Clostridia bacterium]|nr:hypothetical protein [Clostridia bacterium]
MLKSIFDLITGFFDMIIGLVEFLIDFIQDLVLVVYMLNGVGLDVVEWMTWLPSIISTIFVASISIAILYKVVGR